MASLKRALISVDHDKKNQYRRTESEIEKLEKLYVDNVSMFEPLVVSYLPDDFNRLQKEENGQSWLKFPQ